MIILHIYRIKTTVNMLRIIRRRNVGTYFLDLLERAGKSSLIADMDNYVKFYIYDMSLKEVRMNFGLKRLLVGMTNKSLLVIEDIDCSIYLKNRDEDKHSQSNKSHDDEINLSGLLNFIYG
ncbi:hypothetical protein IEQ34_001022 [Dendrobium chrysotoxum]|uniref:Uncharacterized protein n=1 Tax=Dendrobium chrysotoxum TaxID=161865 RepID=A0AAV7HMK0_DENCH|nr:hypothetical protein IEQ34_001022 [Dendrobium chrysotoxum]